LARSSIVLAASLAMASGVRAQTAPSLEADNIVLSRPRPGLDAEGLPLGGFRVYPTLGASVGYNDNIYATTIDRIDSAILELDPSVSVRSNWSRHALNLDASGTIQRYPQRTTENNNTYKIAGSGRVDMASTSHIDLEAHALQSIEARGTAGDIFISGDPVEFHTLGGSGSVTTSFGRLQISGGGGFDRITYDDVKIGDQLFSQHYRDRRQYTASGQVAYNLSPTLQPFVQVSYEHVRYDLRALDTSFDSRGTTVLGGVNISLTKLVTGRIGLGYRWRNYRNPAYLNNDGFTYDVAIVWNPRTLMAVTLEAIKAIDESPSAQSSGIVRNQGSATIDYELLRNIILQVSGTEIFEKYRGVGLANDVSKSDNRFVGSVGARYLMNRFAEVGLRYEHTRQNGSSIVRGAYAANDLRLTLTLQR
jgi:hypothetical protein